MWSFDRRAALALSAAALLPSAARAQGGSAEARLRERGITLPSVQAPVANYVPFVRTGNLVFIAGTGSVGADGRFLTGKVGRDVTPEEAHARARITGLLVLAALRSAVGSLDAVTRAVQVRGMVNAVPEFIQLPRVIDGCTDLFVEVFGDRGRPARSALGMSSLAFDVTIIVEAVFEVA